MHELGQKSRDMRNRIDGSGPDVPDNWNDRRRRRCEPYGNIDGNAYLYSYSNCDCNVYEHGNTGGITVGNAKLRSDGKLHRPGGSDT